MTCPFGPWATAMTPGSRLELSTFWHRRITMLPALLNGRPALTAAGKLRLGLLGIALLALPLLRTDLSATADEPAKDGPKEGIILFERHLRLASVKPDGSDEKYYSKNDGESPVLEHGRLSPDGKHVAYGIRKSEIKEGDAPSQIYVRALTDPHPKEDLGVEGLWWCWGPGGKELAVVSVAMDDKKGLVATNWLVDVHTKKKTELKLPANHLVTDFSPDGKWLLTTVIDIDADKKTQKVQMHLIKPDGSEDRGLATPGLHAAMGRISPDGKKVLFIGIDPEKKRAAGLYVMDVDHGKPRRVDEATNSEAMGACWSPDGKRIAYIWRQHDEQAKADQETESFLIVADADGKNAKTIVTEKAKSPGIITIENPDWR
jgi:dipeptidyl aminopeptidase/acylaminoacyl peptidase